MNGNPGAERSFPELPDQVAITRIMVFREVVGPQAPRGPLLQVVVSAETAFFGRSLLQLAFPFDWRSVNLPSFPSVLTFPTQER